MPAEKDKKAIQQRIARFREDIHFLQDRYRNETMKRVLEVKDKGNFSKFLGEKGKNPPISLINRFYEVYKEDLIRFNRELPPTPSVEESTGLYGTDERTLLKFILDELSSIHEVLKTLSSSQVVSDLQKRIENLEKQVPPSDPFSKDNA